MGQRAEPGLSEPKDRKRRGLFQSERQMEKPLLVAAWNQEPGTQA